MSTKIGVIAEGVIDHTLLSPLLERIAHDRAGYGWPVDAADMAEVFHIRKRGHGGVLKTVERLVTALNDSLFDHAFFVIVLDRRTLPVQEKIRGLLPSKARFVVGTAIREIEAWWLGARENTHPGGFRLEQGEAGMGTHDDGQSGAGSPETQPGLPPECAVEVSRLTKLYGDFAAVRGLGFTVRRGQIVGLVGPNGAGKTTALRAIAGIHPPTEGSIRICGFDLATDPIEAKRRLSFMPDEPRLFDYLSVEEHLRFVCRIYGASDWKRRAAELLDELELAGKRRSLPAELSRGMRQKLVIACGLIHQPEVLLFDEPLTGLDPLGIRKMKNTILQRAREGTAIILSSHLLHLVEELCDAVVILHQGQKVSEGSVSELKRGVAAGQNLTLEETFIRITSGNGNGDR